MKKAVEVGTSDSLPTYWIVWPFAFNTKGAGTVKVCPTDATLSRPAELSRATTTIFTVSVNGTVMVAVNELMELVTPDTTELSDAFRTCTAVTPESTLYVMLAVLPEYVMLPDNVGAANCFSKVCATDAALTRPAELVRATTTTFVVMLEKLYEMATLVPLAV